MSPLDIAVALVSAAIGYAAGSLPASPAIGRLAGIEAARQGDASHSPASVWTQSGPGWGLLAFAADLAKGIVPVALAAVTCSWGAGWAAGAGAVAGAAWPALRHRGGAGGGGGAVIAGVALALEPAAGFIAAVLGLIALGIARLAGRRGEAVAVSVAAISYPLLFAGAERDFPRLAGVMAIYALAAVRFGAAGRRRGRAGTGVSIR